MTLRTYKKGYLPGADGQYHRVSNEIWLEYMRSVWREDAVMRREKEPVTGNNSCEGSRFRNCFPRVVSIDSIFEAHGEQILPGSRSAEEEAVTNEIRTLLYTDMYRAMEALDPEELFLLRKLYLEGDGMSIREFANRYKEPRTTVQYRRKRALNKVRGLMEKGSDFSLDLIL